MMLQNPVGRIVTVEPERAPDLLAQGFTRPVLLREHPEGAPGTALVARPYGGFGDMICLRPAVLQLAQRADLTLMIEEKYFCLFPEVQKKVSYPYDLALTQHRYSYGTGASFELTFEDGFTERRFRTVYDCWCPCGDHEFDTGYRPTKSRVQIFAEHLGVAVRPPDCRRVIDREDAREEAHAWGVQTGLLREPEPLYDDRYPVIGIQWDALHESKKWPLGRFGALVCALLDAYPDSGIVLFHATDRLAAGFGKPDRVFDCVGLSLPGLGCVIPGLDVMVGADSGLIHYALALGIPSVGLFGPTDGQLTMAAYNGRARWTAIQAPHLPSWPCRVPCYYSRPDNGYWCEHKKNHPRQGACMEAIQVAPVLKAVGDILGAGDRDG